MLIVSNLIKQLNNKLMSTNSSLLTFLFILLIGLCFGSTIQGRDRHKFIQEIGEKIDVQNNELSIDEQTIKQIKQKQLANDKKTFEDALYQRQKLQRQYAAKIRRQNSLKNIRIPQKIHNGQHFYYNGGRRLLNSVNNQYSQIDEGNSNQVTDGNYVYSLQYSNLTIHKVQGAQLILIQQIKYLPPLFPSQIHAANGYLAVIFQFYSPNATMVKVYQNSGFNVTEIKQYKTEGVYIASRSYNNYLLIMVQKQMKSSKLDYPWTVDGVNVSSKVYNGASANKTSKNLGNAVRLFAKIFLGPASNKHQFATFLFCDYAWNLIMTQTLNVITAGNYYNSSGHSVAFQLFSFNQKIGQTWGTSKWIILPGLINCDYQVHQFNNYLRVVLFYTEGELGTKGHISIAKIPIDSCDPKQGKIYHQLGLDGPIFVSSRFIDDAAILIFSDGTIKTFSTSFETFIDSIKVKQKIIFIYPYGPSDMIGFGTNEQGNNVALVRFAFSGYKLIYKQSITIKSSAFSYSQYDWLSTKFIQLDWKQKLITFPIFSSENQPYRSGYYQIYANPLQNCLSSLPVPNPCPQTQQNQAIIVGKTFKHWDNQTGYDYNSGPSQQIRRSSTIVNNGKVTLITCSSCQLQARLIKSSLQNSIYSPRNQSQITFYDLCK